MKNRYTHALWGLFFVFIGLGIGLNVIGLWDDFNLFFKGWWTLLIIIPCFISMIQSRFGFGSTIGFIIGLLLFLSYRFDFQFSIWELVVPIALIFIGIRITFQNQFRRRHRDQSTQHNSQEPYHTMNGSEYNAIFSGNKIYIDHEVFQGTNVSAVFGGVTLDLRDAIIQNDVDINATAVFGGVDIYVPQGIKVKCNNVPIFGGVSDKVQRFTDPAAPTIYLNSICVFGGIDIK